MHALMPDNGEAMSTLTRRLAAGVTTPALVLGGLTLATVAAPLPAHAAGQCVAPTGTVTVFGFNDFHGRLADVAANGTVTPLAARLFTPVEAARAAQGEDNVLLLSSGDNIGGSTFVSMSANDEPTLKVLDAAGVEVITVGNHEFDKGWADLRDRVIPHNTTSPIPYLGANVYAKGTTTVAAPLKEYQLFTKGGVTIAVVGAVTRDLPSLVSPAGITDLTIGDPVEAINRVAKQLSNGDPADGEADIVIASLHEGAGNQARTAAENAADSAAFNDIYSKIDPSVSVVFNAHTHQLYNWKTTGDKPLLQAASYATNIAKVDLSVDATNKGLCGVTTDVPKAPTTVGTGARLTAINTIVTDAVAAAKVKGAEIKGYANRAISTPADGGTNIRYAESPMSNLVAQMFYDRLGNGNTEFIGIQNPGGNRYSFDRGAITYEEAALVLPFANSLFTTQVTGAQFKTVLEQQWQRDEKGNVPTRAYLALGLSKNVSYTFDENRAEGDRITSIMINGKPIDPAKLYTVGSGSFLISGGDNFRELGKGTGTADTGRADLEEWVKWLEASDALNPDYTKRGVSLTGTTTTITEGAAATTFTLGQPKAGGVQIDTLDMLLNPTGTRVSPQLANTKITARIGGTVVGEGTVTAGVGSVAVSLPKASAVAAGAQLVEFTVETSGTKVLWPVTVVKATVTPPVTTPPVTTPPVTTPPTTPPGPVNIYTTPGVHHVNGRIWMTACEPYSATTRCWTYIWGTQISFVNGMFVKTNAWMFNNMTYLPAPKSLWGSNPLANTGTWTASDGRQWKTECGTALTGRDACRSWSMTSVIVETKGAGGKSTYAFVKQWVFNNIVILSKS